jgi:hypothetical protein
MSDPARHTCHVLRRVGECEHHWILCPSASQTLPDRWVVACLNALVWLLCLTTGAGAGVTGLDPRNLEERLAQGRAQTGRCIGCLIRFPRILPGEKLDLPVQAIEPNGGLGIDFLLSVWDQVYSKLCGASPRHLVEQEVWANSTGTHDWWRRHAAFAR